MSATARSIFSWSRKPCENRKTRNLVFSWEMFRLVLFLHLCPHQKFIKISDECKYWHWKSYSIWAKQIIRCVMKIWKWIFHVSVNASTSAATSFRGKAPCLRCEWKVFLFSPAPKSRKTNCSVFIRKYPRKTTRHTQKRVDAGLSSWREELCVLLIQFITIRIVARENWLNFSLVSLSEEIPLVERAVVDVRRTHIIWIHLASLEWMIS